MDHGLDLGINFFDTANVYGDGRGLTEQIIGRWFAQGDRRREKVVLATKVYDARSDRGRTTARLSALHIRQACEDSLRRLQTDHIDLYQMHHVDRDTPWDEIWQAMDLLVAAGQGALRRQQQLRRLAHRQGERSGGQTRARSVWCPSRASTTSTPARSSSRCFRRAQRLRRRRHPVEPARRRPARRRAADKATEGRRGGERVQTQIEAHAPEARGVGEAVRRARRRSPPTSRWRGCSTTRPSPRRSSGRAPSEQLDGRARRARRRSSTIDVLAELDEIFPGPGGAAPEAYAW